MKRLTLIIIGVLLCTPLYSDMNPYIAGAGVPVSVDPIFYSKLDSVGGTDSAQVYDEISASWVGARANLGAFVTGYDGNAYEADAMSEYFTTPASIVGGTTELTVRFRYMANNAGKNTVFPLYHHNSYGSDRLYFNHNTDGTNGSVTYRANTGTEAVITFTKPSDASWHEVYLAVDMSAGNIYVYIDESLAGSTTSNANVVDWGAQSDDSRWCHIVNTVAGRYCVIDELRIYHDIVTP